jgi:post-segregation antitoxin (ccd killing protein)
MSNTNTNIPAEVIERIASLEVGIAYCDTALAAELENWERKEYQQVRDEAAATLAQIKAAVEFYS